LGKRLKLLCIKGRQLNQYKLRIKIKN